MDFHIEQSNIESWEIMCDGHIEHGVYIWVGKHVSMSTYIYFH